MRKKNNKHFKQMKPIEVETTGLPDKVRVGYKDIKIKYVRPDFKKWQMTDCFGEYDYRQNLIHIQHDLCGQERVNTIFHEIMHAAVQVSGLNQEKCALEKDEHEESVVNVLSNMMMAVFRDNPWLIEMIKKDIENTD